MLKQQTLVFDYWDNEKKNKENLEPFILKDNSILEIDMQTLKIINEFLNDMKNNTKVNSFYRTAGIEAFELRFKFYQDYYEKYYNRVIDSDKEVYKKLINYLTAQGRDSSSSEGATNMPLYIEYKVEYNSKILEGIYRKETFYNETSLSYQLKNFVFDELDMQDLDYSKKQEVLEKMNIILHIGFDFVLDFSNKDSLLEKVSNVVNSDHFRNWKFSGKRTEKEISILNYIFSAKYEVNSHEGKNRIIYDNINIDTCRYAAHLMGTVKVGEHSKIKTIEEKNELYNDLYPFYLQQICTQDRDLFSKLVNFLSFENEKYSILGYNKFLNYSKEAIKKKLEKFEVIKCIDEKENRKKGTKQNKKLEQTQSIQTNYSRFKFEFIGGCGVSNNEEFRKKQLSALTNILNDELFKNWKFSGLKIAEENLYELNYEDKLKSINFSEDSYYILGYVINLIYNKKSKQERKILKDTILPKILEYIPTREKEVFIKLIDRFTKEDEEGFYVDTKYMYLETEIRTKDSNLCVATVISKGINKYKDVDDKALINEIKNASRYNSYLYTENKENINEDNYKDIFTLIHKPKERILPTNLTGLDEYRDYEMCKNILLDILEVKEEKQNSTQLIKSEEEYLELDKYEIIELNKQSPKIKARKNKIQNLITNEINIQGQLMFNFR